MKEEPPLPPGLLEIIRDDRLCRFVRYWGSLRGDRQVPFRRDLDPIDVPWILPHIWMWDYLPALNTFRSRLAGDSIISIYGYNPAGHFLEDFIPQNFLENVRARYVKVLSVPAVVHAAGRVYLGGGGEAWGERVILPFASQDGTVDVLIGATVYDWDRTRHAPGVVNERQDVIHFPLDGRQRPYSEAVAS